MKCICGARIKVPDSAAGRRARCPKCGESLSERTMRSVTVDECLKCGGIWFDKGEFEEIAARENEGWLGSLLRARSR